MVRKHKRDSKELRNTVDTLLDEGMKFANDKNYEEAQKLFLRAMKIAPKNPEVVYNLARVNFDCEKYAEAITLSEELLKAHPQNVNALLLLANTYNVLSNDKRAEEYYESAYQQEHDNPHVLFSYAGWLLKMMRLNEAKNMLDIIDNLFPNNPGTTLLRFRLGVLESHEMGKDEFNHPTCEEQLNHSNSVSGAADTDNSHGTIPNDTTVNKTYTSDSAMNNIEAKLVDSLVEPGEIYDRIIMVASPAKRIDDNVSTLTCEYRVLYHSFG